VLGYEIHSPPVLVVPGSLSAPQDKSAPNSALVPVASSAILASPSCPILPASQPIVVGGGSSDDPFLQAGALLQIQGVFYRIGEPLGMGSFGAVWGAERCDGTCGSVAIKEILCRSSKDLADAMLESKLLNMIHDARPEENSLAGKVPDLVGKEAQPIGPDQWMMRLAMTKVPGMQLDNFLEMCNTPQLQGSEDASAAAVAVATQCCSLAGACRFATSLLLQLSAIFERMASVVYHRDVSPHNVLIDVADPQNPNFGLVDFGLGIDVQSWIGPKGSTSWHHVDIGGDCRYWPVSVWIMFVDGSPELDQMPALSREYQERLDFHAVGITVLEVLMQLLPQAALDAEAIQGLRSAWTAYWQDVHRFWTKTMEVFDSGEDPSEFKRWIKGEGQVAEILGARLTAIRAALRQASSGSTPEASRLFGALLQLISNAGCDPLNTPKWSDIRASISSESMAARTLSSRSPIMGATVVKAPLLNAGGSLMLPAKTSTTLSATYGGSMLVPSGTHLQQGSMLLPAGTRIGPATTLSTTGVRPATSLAATYQALRVRSAQ
jgi:serine/threonine protein kinase